MKKIGIGVLLAGIMLNPAPAMPQIGQFSSAEVGDCQYITIMARQVAAACTRLLETKRATPGETLTILRNRANAYADLSLFDQAKADLDRAFSLAETNSEKADLWYLKARIAHDRGECSEAVEGYDKAIELDPPHEPAEAWKKELGESRACKAA